MSSPRSVLGAVHFSAPCPPLVGETISVVDVQVCRASGPLLAEGYRPEMELDAVACGEPVSTPFVGACAEAKRLVVRERSTDVSDREDRCNSVQGGHDAIKAEYVATRGCEAQALGHGAVCGVDPRCPRRVRLAALARVARSDPASRHISGETTRRLGSVRSVGGPLIPAIDSGRRPSAPGSTCRCRRYVDAVGQ
jgi:hypothetical protein